MKLTLRKSELEDWYVIERAEHDGSMRLEPTQFGSSLWCASRFSDADVEGDAAEMRAIAAAIESRSAVYFRRCAVDASHEPVMFCSPRNSQVDGECTLAEADALAVEIRRVLPEMSEVSG